MRNKYLQQDQAQRVDGGLAFYKEKPVFVRSNGQNTELYDLSAEVHKATIRHDDPFLDLSSPKLGYSNTRDYCVYLSRVPTRRYKQTLSLEVVQGFVPLYGLVGQEKIATALFSKNGERMFAREYPDLASTLLNLQKSIAEGKKLRSQAISSEIGLGIDSFSIVHVFFKETEIGIIKPNETVVRIPHSANAWVISKYISDFSWEID